MAAAATFLLFNRSFHTILCSFIQPARHVLRSDMGRDKKTARSSCRVQSPCRSAPDCFEAPHRQCNCQTALSFPLPSCLFHLRHQRLPVLPAFVGFIGRRLMLDGHHTTRQPSSFHLSRQQTTQSSQDPAKSNTPTPKFRLRSAEPTSQQAVFTDQDQLTRARLSVPLNDSALIHCFILRRRRC